MPISKKPLTYLKNIRLVLVAYFKNKKLEQTQCFSIKLFFINDNMLSINNIGNKNMDVDKKKF